MSDQRLEHSDSQADERKASDTSACQRLFEQAYFTPAYESFSPVRPSGLGQMPIGHSAITDTGKGIDWRKARIDYDAWTKTTTYSYSGELEDSGLFSCDTAFKGAETLDSCNNLISSWVTYSKPVTQTFMCPEVGSVTIKDVVKVETEYSDFSNAYFSTVTTASGDKHRFVTDPDGVVNWYEHNYFFRYRRDGR
jgi:hypothetical protein